VPRNRDLRRLTRGLRFRLTASYALFFAVLLMAVAGLFRQRLKSEFDTQIRDDLNEQWAAMKGYLRIEKDAELGRYASNWYYDDEDADESAIVLDLRKICLVADADGNAIPNAKTKDPEISTGYEDIGIDRPAEIQAMVRAATASRTPKIFWTERQNAKGERFLIRSGIVFSEAHVAPYYVAIGLPLAQNNNILRQFTLIYVAVFPAALILGSLLGWFMAGRALTPVLAVAQTAQRISGSNLSLRIPTRQAGDELDYLILTFNRMIERLESSFQQMKQFSADVSHELRTPITGIRGQLEVALFTAKTTEQYREAMFNALQDIDRLSQIVRALLLLSQAESGQLVLQKSRLNLGEVVEDLVEQFQIPAEAAGVRLTADVAPNCHALVDRVQIERLINNLLSNAIKFTPEGGQVRMALKRSPEHIEMVVEDTGCGIASEYLPHIFDRFYRVPGSGAKSGSEQGLGLGLSFVAWIVKAHRGTIEVESTPGTGTRFTIKLPADGAGADTLELAGEPASFS
jgi:heavy metal sensor kinase